MKNNQKGFANLVLIGVVIIVLGIGGYFMARKSSPTKEEQIPTQTPNSASEVGIANWKTYTNTQYGFELKYPTEWAIKEGVFIQIVPPNSQRVSIILSIDNSGGACIGNPVCVKEVYESYHGLNWTVQYDKFSDDNQPDTYGKNAYTNKNEKYFVLTSLNADQNFKDQIFDQILSTFKFTK